MVVQVVAEEARAGGAGVWQGRHVRLTAIRASLGGLPSTLKLHGMPNRYSGCNRDAPPCELSAARASSMGTMSGGLPGEKLLRLAGQRRVRGV